MRERKYAYEQVKVLRHYGERDELQEFLDLANERGYEIEEALDIGSGYYVFRYTY